MTARETLMQKIQVLNVIQYIFDRVEDQAQGRRNGWLDDPETGKWVEYVKTDSELDDEDRAYLAALETVKTHLMKLA